MSESILIKTGDFVKRHPLAIGGTVVGGLLLYMLLSSSSSASTSATNSPGVDPNVIAYNSQMAQLQYSAAAQSNQLSAQLAIAQIGANSSLANTDAAKTVSLAGIQAQQNIQTYGDSSQVAIAQITNQTAQAQITAARDIAIGQDATYAQIAQINGATQLGIAETGALATTIESLSGKKYATISATSPTGLSFDVNTGKSGGGSSNIGGILTGAASLASVFI